MPYKTNYCIVRLQFHVTELSFTRIIIGEGMIITRERIPAH